MSFLGELMKETANRRLLGRVVVIAERELHVHSVPNRSPLDVKRLREPLTAIKADIIKKILFPLKDSFHEGYWRIEIVCPHRILRFYSEDHDLIFHFREQLRLSMSFDGSTGVPAPKDVKHISKDRISVDDFELVRIVGKGQTTKVIQVLFKPTLDTFAMKVIRKSCMGYDLKAYELVRQLDHPFLVKTLNRFESEDKFYFIQDYIHGGELFYHLQKVKRFSIERARFYFAEIALALDYLHSKGLQYHGSLAPEKVLVRSNGHIAITGYFPKNADYIFPSRPFNHLPEYIPPEILRGEKFDKSSDWWNLGTLLYEMLYALPPFYTDNINEMYDNILNKALTFDPKRPNPEANDLISKMLNREVKDRLKSLEELKSHPFLREIDWDELSAQQVCPPLVPEIPHEDGIDDEELFEGFTYAPIYDYPPQAEDHPFLSFTFNPNC